MDAVVFNDRLNKALALVSRIITSKNQLPVLGNVLLTAEKGILLITTTNLETSITTKINAVVNLEGKTTVPAKQMLELTSLIKDEKLRISFKNNILIIEGKNTKNSLNTTPVKEFPTTTFKKNQINLILDKKEFIKTINQIAISTSQDETRPILGGVKITPKGELLEIATTDGYRLTVKKINTGKQKIEKEIIVPIKTLLEAVKVALEEKEEKIKIMILERENQIIFIFEDTEIISRLIGGNFPDFYKIIPVSFTTRIIINREELLNAVKIAAIFARESANIIRLVIKNKTLILSSNAPSVGENRTEIKIDQEGEDINIAFNYRFLLDFLNSIDEERIIFETNGSLNPGVFKGEKEKNFLHIIMPVRVQE